MPRRFLIRFQNDDTTAWLELDRDQRPLHEARPGLPAPEADAEYIAIVPSEDVLLLPAPTVAGSRLQRRQAIPFAIEEQLAAPIEQLHIAIAGAGGAGEIVAVTGRERMQYWLDQLRSAGLEADRMLPEACLLEYSPDTFSLLIENERVVMRHARAGAITGDATNMPSLLGLALAESHPLVTLTAHTVGKTTAALPADAIIKHHEEALCLLAAALPATAAPDLLQGEFAARRSRDDVRRYWRAAALLAGLSVVFLLAFAIAEQRVLAAHLQQRQAEMEALFRQVAPNATRVFDPAGQLRSLLRQQGTDNDRGGLALLARIAPLAGASGLYTLDGLEYRNRTLEVILRAKDVAALDLLRERIAARPSISAELTAATPGTGDVEGRLRIRQAGSS